MSRSALDFDYNQVLRAVSEIEDSVEVVNKLGKEYDSIIDELSGVWVTEPGKKRIQNLKDVKVEQYDGFIKDLRNDHNRLTEMKKSLFNINNT